LAGVEPKRIKCGRNPKPARHGFGFVDGESQALRIYLPPASGAVEGIVTQEVDKE